MLDTIISKNNYAYQFRVDVLDAYKQIMIKGKLYDINHDADLLKQYYMQQLCKFVVQEEFADWICAFEIAPKSGKPHFQCILWHKEKFTETKKNSLKAKYFRKNRDTKNSISFTSAKKINNLSSYVFKDHQEYQENQNVEDHNLISTLNYEQVILIPKWLTKNALKAKWKQDLEDQILIIISEDEYGRRPTKHAFARQVIQFYIQEDHPPPSRMCLYKLLLKYLPSYTIETYLEDIGFEDPSPYDKY